MKIFEGIVISTKMQNSSIVEVISKRPHPLYRKLIKVSKKFIVDNNMLEPIVGQKAKIGETKPMSKTKHFKILEIISDDNKNKTKIVKKTTSDSKKGEK
jgi:small subunit ribosomal protein S17